MFKNILTPGSYHGLHKKPPFFEGWYYKLVSADEKHKLAIIPGVILGQDAHSFVQVLEGVSGAAVFHRLPEREFTASPTRLDIRVGENHFDDRGLSLNIDRPEGRLHGSIQLGPLNPWPVSLLSPGIMGWYAWVPGMECYHGVLSFDHDLQGTLTLDGRRMDFSGGRGYIEKDWGQSFPSAWVWFQSNHFKEARACITASVAIIPWQRRSFRGFIVGLWHERRLYRFATYTGAEIDALDILPDHVRWVIVDKEHKLELIARRAASGLILGPTRVEMGMRVNETLLATVEARLETRKGKIMFNEIGRNAGLEVQGDLERLQRGES